MRYKQDKVIYLSFEATEDCQLNLSLYQNTITDLEKQISVGLIKKASLKAKSQPKSVAANPS